ncbi:MAG: ATP-binding cassette domain-containing protein [Methanosarcinales archaeon]|nr:ATP-binding cassette domain-containing protein [ANME-2 cluster archaeon]MDF1532521.1 ATP-binding cassette domain-containing protein [ANME-2 cluster archaeon]MDW7776875.1 ATP-binding cassette domain-containing protein [Methanosarcinales archaeon]
MNTPAIETFDLTRRFDDLVAVDKISIKIEQGELFGLLGPNGAGKTTFINMLSTMIPPSNGRAEVWGIDVRANPSRVRQNIGVVFQGTTLDDRLTGRENLDLHGRLYGLSGKMRKQRISEVLELVELGNKAEVLVKTYSGGMMRRLEIARGLMHHPRVLFLDEPTLGLDPQTRNHIWDYIRRLNREENVTIMLTTHYMEEADQLCKRIAIIDHGGIKALDTPEHLKNALGGDVVGLGTENDIQASLLCDLYDRNGSAGNVHFKDNMVQITVPDGTHQIPHLLKLAAEAGIPILSVDLHRPTLDDVFLSYTGRDIRVEEASDVDRITYKLQGRRR